MNRQQLEQRLFQLKEEFNEQHISPLNFGYFHYLEQFEAKGYNPLECQNMALCKVKNNLLKKYGYKK